MSYEIIQPPFTLRFQEMAKSELKEYYAWFMSIKPERIRGLESYVRESVVGWKADNSPESLILLGEWFHGQVETRPRTEEEMREAKASLKFAVEVSTEQLTNRTFSLAVDIAMYLSEVVLKNISGTSWALSLGNKKDADYGQPIITGFGKVSLNPVWIVVTLAYGIAKKSKDGRRLRELFDTWANMRKTNCRT